MLVKRKACVQAWINSSILFRTFACVVVLNNSMRKSQFSLVKNSSWIAAPQFFAKLSRTISANSVVCGLIVCNFLLMDWIACLALKWIHFRHLPQWMVNGMIRMYTYVTSFWRTMSQTNRIDDQSGSSCKCEHALSKNKRQFYCKTIWW